MQTTMMRIRLPAPLHEQVREDAERHDRSMNAEITQILKKHFGITTFRKSPKAGA